jgi:Arc/MetJ-type ribon-helix-helix transcriptional regulator
LIRLLSVFFDNGSLVIFMPKRYRNVSIPVELYEKLEKLVESKQAGYVSVSDAVKDAVRELLRKNKLLP